MLQPHSITFKPCSIPTHYLFTPKSFPLGLAGAASIHKHTPTLSLTVKCRHQEFFDPTARYPSPPPQRSQPVKDLPPRVYVGHTVYKGRGVLTVSPRPPEFTALDSGAFKVSKEGFLLLQFAPAAGMRQYDWNRKQVFALSVSEMGTLISLGARESCEFFHDPFKGKSDEGKLRKVLKVEPLQDGSGHLFNLSVQNKLDNMDERIFIPVTKAELAVFRSIFNYIMPYLLGWHAFGNNIKPEISSRVNNANSDYEWNR